MRLTTTVTAAMLDALDAQVGSTGFFRLYQGDPDSAGTLIATCAMNNPAFNAASGTSMTMDNSPAVDDTSPNAATTGVTYAGIYASSGATAGAWVVKLGVNTGGSPDLTMANNTVATTDTVTISSFSITLAQGTPDTA